MPSPYIKIPRYEFERMLKLVTVISTMDKTDLPDAGSSYAHALGACNGLAKSIKADMEYYAEAGK
jgi:hypothetical protein